MIWKLKNYHYFQLNDEVVVVKIKLFKFNAVEFDFF